MKLRPYQMEAVGDVRQAIMEGSKAPILVAPCGSGKTLIAAHIIDSARQHGRRTLFIAPRRELIYQASTRLWETFRHDHGVIMAGEPPSYSTSQVASFDTLWSRARRGGGTELKLPRSDLVICDEAHLSISDTRQTILNAYLEMGAVVIGLTATPARGDGRGLGEIYDRLVRVKDTRWFIDEGYLVPAVYYAPSKPDLDKIRVKGSGDYVEKDLSKKMTDAKLVGEIVDQWMKLANRRSTVVFCVDRAHSRFVCERFLEAGVRAEHLDGETPTDERAEILERVATGETEVLCNVYVATYGLDIPSLECAVLARPTKNITLYQQTLGRVMRTCNATGKTDALVIDHAGAVAEHGFFDTPIEWTLDSSKDVRELTRKAKEEREDPKEITCPQCHYTFIARHVCPMCGFKIVPPGEDVPVHKADLKKVRGNDAISTKERAEFFAGLKYYGMTKGRKPGWAAHAYKEKFGEWPNDPQVRDVLPAPPGPMAEGFIKYLNIKAAKRRSANG